MIPGQTFFSVMLIVQYNLYETNHCQTISYSFLCIVRMKPQHCGMASLNYITLHNPKCITRNYITPKCALKKVLHPSTRVRSRFKYKALSQSLAQSNVQQYLLAVSQNNPVLQSADLKPFMKPCVLCSTTGRWMSWPHSMM